MKKLKYTKEKIEEAVKNSKSYSDMARFFNRKPSGGTLGLYSKLVKEYDLDKSHFTGQGHLKNKVSNTRKEAKHFLVKSDKMQKGSLLKRSLLESGIENKCAECGIEPRWNGKDLCLTADHVNGDNTDHREENLRLLCPNCHSQTDTFGGRNKV